MLIYGEPPKPKPELVDVELDPADTWLIVGSSPYINEVKKYIPSLLKKYRSIACNVVSQYFQGFGYIATNDYFPQSNLKIIVNWQKNKKEILENYKKYKIEYIFTPTIITPILEEKPILIEGFEVYELFGRHTIALPAINYALLKGAKNIVLIGIDFNLAWNRFYEKDRKIMPQAIYSLQLRQNRMINCLNKLRQRINVFNVNPVTETQTPVIDIRSL
jgi:hypothetical protein